MRDDPAMPGSVDTRARCPAGLPFELEMGAGADGERHADHASQSTIEGGSTDKGATALEMQHVGTGIAVDFPLFSHVCSKVPC